MGIMWKFNNNAANVKEETHQNFALTQTMGNKHVHIQQRRYVNNQKLLDAKMREFLCFGVSFIKC